MLTTLKVIRKGGGSIVFLVVLSMVMLGSLLSCSKGDDADIQVGVTLQMHALEEVHNGRLFWVEEVQRR